MKILLDTHLLIWLIGASERLHPAAREIIEDVNNELFSVLPASGNYR